jgi:hypothetical protein
MIDRDHIHVVREEAIVATAESLLKFGVVRV